MSGGDIDLTFRRIPCIFGMGVIFAREDARAEAIAALLDPLHEHDLLDRLERNRLDLFLTVLRMRDELDHHERGVAGLIAGLERELADEKAENARLRLELATESSSARPA